MQLPGRLNEALATWMAQHGRGGLVGATQNLSASYRKGETSSQVNLAAYVATRVAATFKANQVVQQELLFVMPDFAPKSVLDIGAGPGVASWAAVEAWPSICKLTQCEQDKQFAHLAVELNVASEVDALTTANIILKSEATLATDVAADLVVASYMLAEIPLPLIQQTALRMWGRTQRIMVLIEPGTPQGFSRMRTIRDVLLQHGAFILAPCTHQNKCPVVGHDWCHFKTRVQRSREHMHAKQAAVPFEDEAYTYLILSRQPGVTGGARIVAPPVQSKPSITLRLCDENGLGDVVIASRAKPTYKRAKKKAWGDVWE